MKQYDTQIKREFERIRKELEKMNNQFLKMLKQNERKRNTKKL